MLLGLLKKQQQGKLSKARRIGIAGWSFFLLSLVSFTSFFHLEMPPHQKREEGRRCHCAGKPSQLKGSDNKSLAQGDLGGVSHQPLWNRDTAHRLKLQTCRWLGPVWDFADEGSRQRHFGCVNALMRGDPMLKQIGWTTVCHIWCLNLWAQ